MGERERAAHSAAGRVAAQQGHLPEGKASPGWITCIQSMALVGQKVLCLFYICRWTQLSSLCI